MKKKEIYINALQRLKVERDSYCKDKEDIKNKIINYKSDDKYRIKLLYDLLEETEGTLKSVEVKIQDYLILLENLGKEESRKNCGL